MDEERKKELNVHNGVTVTHVDGLSAEAGLQAEDVIIAINNRDIHNEKEFKIATEKLDLTHPNVFLAKRKNVTQYILISAEKR